MVLISNETEWFRQIPDEIRQTGSKSSGAPHAVNIGSLRQEAAAVYEQDVADFNKKCQRDKEIRDFKWMQTLLQKGTMNDKMAAYTVMIQTSPVHNLKALNTLVGLVDTKCKDQGHLALSTAKELFLLNMLPDWELRTFDRQPLERLRDLKPDARKKALALLYFEEQLKAEYDRFIGQIQKMAMDTVEKTKIKAVMALADLLAKSELHEIIISKLVNKLGDPTKSVAAKTLHCLRAALQRNSSLKSTFAVEIERLLYRNNVGKRPQYYAMCFLNQILFDQEDAPLAAKLIGIYFSFFKACVKTGEVDSKLMSALLAGVNRAYPFAKGELHQLNEQVDTMFKIVHLVPFNIGVQTLMLLFLVTSKDTLSDRFYTSLYRLLNSTEMIYGSSKRLPMALNLLYKSLKSDVSEKRVKAFVKRLLQIALSAPVHLTCGILFLVSETVRLRPRVLEAKSVFPQDEGEERYEDVDERSDGEENGDSAPLPSKAKLSWVHSKNLYGKAAQTGSYDPHCRNPLYAGTEYTQMWELEALSRHSHPTVKLFAHSLLQGELVECSGDPLEDYTLIHFLDRFVFRNPKKDVNVSRKVFTHKFRFTKSGSKALSANSVEFRRQEESEVPPEDMFYYRYFQNRTSEKKSSHDDSDIESVSDGECDRIFEEKLQKKKKKKVEDRSKEDESKEDNSGDDTSVDLNLEDLSDNEGGSADEDEIDFDDDESFDGAFDDVLDSDDEAEPIQPKKKKAKISGDDDDFMDADEFSKMLEENVTTDTTGINALANKDKASVKQLNWETKRNQQMRGGFRKPHWKKQKFAGKRKK